MYCIGIYSALHGGFFHTVPAFIFWGLVLCTMSGFSLHFIYICLVSHNSLVSQFRFPFSHGTFLIHSTNVHYAPLIHGKRNGETEDSVSSRACGFGVSCFFSWLLFTSGYASGTCYVPTCNSKSRKKEKRKNVGAYQYPEYVHLVYVTSLPPLVLNPYTTKTQEERRRKE